MHVGGQKKQNKNLMNKMFYSLEMFQMIKKKLANLHFEILLPKILWMWTKLLPDLTF